MINVLSTKKKRKKKSGIVWSLKKGCLEGREPATQSRKEFWPGDARGASSAWYTLPGEGYFFWNYLSQEKNLHKNTLILGILFDNTDNIFCFQKFFFWFWRILVLFIKNKNLLSFHINTCMNNFKSVFLPFCFIFSFLPFLFPLSLPLTII